MEQRGLDIHEVTVGMQATYSQTITDSDIKSFAGLSGDRNPVHIDEEYAKSSRFKKRIAHGLLSGSFFSALFGTRLPGEGCVYVAQNLKFIRPVYLGDTVTAMIKVTRVDIDKRRVYFKTSCKVRGRYVIDGDAEIFIPEKNKD